MKKKNNLLIAFIALISLLSLGSCKKAQNDLAPVNKEKTTTGALDHIKSLGFRDSEIKDIGDDYLVDGDILFSKKATYTSTQNSGSKLSVNQYGAQNYLGLNTHVLILVDPSMNGYINEINSAIAQWNAVPNCRVKFAISNASLYNLVITAMDLGAGYCGAAYTPRDGSPGDHVYINTGYIASKPFEQRQRTITHELGHAIGFLHTNWFAVNEQSSGTYGNGARYYATNIFGTPTGYEFSSLMNGGECGIGATVLSDYDKIAAQYIYPQNPPVAGTVPVFRYHHIYNGDHFYTTDYSELAQGSNNEYIFEGIGFFAYTTQVAGTEPVYRYYGDDVGDHFYTRSSVTPGRYHFERIAFYAYGSALNGSVPVYRYNNHTNGDHFYTKNQNEPLSNYFYEDIPFYIY